MERELLITEQVQLFFSLAQVRHFWLYFWFRNTSTPTPFLKMSGCQRFNCLQTQSPLLVKLSQVEKPIFLGYSVSHVADASFPTMHFPCCQFSIKMLQYASTDLVCLTQLVQLIIITWTTVRLAVVPMIVAVCIELDQEIHGIHVV